MNFRKMNQYICAAVLAATMSVTTMGAATISDVASNHWAYSAVVDLENRGIMVLTSNGQFYPDQTMNYFEVADVIAKATGYVDVDIVKNVDPTFKQQVKENYAKQKATLDSYASKYSTWNSGYNQQIAYLLGRGYMKTSDLDKFITKTAKGETRNIITKENLAVYIVRMLSKEKTALDSFKTTTFKDDNTLQAANKPYLAYLKTAGIVKPDAKGNANGTMKVTKALCAKMVSDALKIKDTSKVGIITTPATNTPQANTPTTTTPAPTTPAPTPTPTPTSSEIYTVGRVATKNSTEYYILLELANGEQHYYSFKSTSKITDVTGADMPITKLTVGTKVKAPIETENGTMYITSIQVVDSTTTDNSTVSPTPSVDPNTNSTTTTNPTTSANTNIVEGTLVGNVSNGVLRISFADGTTKPYIIANNCTTILNNQPEANTDCLASGDKITLTLENSAVVKIVAIKGKDNVNNLQVGNAGTLSGGEVKAKKFAGNNHIFTVKQNSTEENITISNDVNVTRNGKMVELDEVRVGDMITFTRSNNVIKAVNATGVKSTVEGTIKALHIAANSEVVMTVKNEEVTYPLASDVELYDNNTNKYISVRDLHLGQEVTVVLESQEIVSIDIDKSNKTYNLMGTIVNTGRNYNYIDVLVDYDYVSGESKVYKRIQLPNDVKVVVNGKNKTRSALKEDADVIISYKYLDDTVPERIVVVQ